MCVHWLKASEVAVVKVARGRAALSQLVALRGSIIGLMRYTRINWEEAKELAAPPQDVPFSLVHLRDLELFTLQKFFWGL